MVQALTCSEEIDMGNGSNRSFVDLVNDPHFIAQQKAEREQSDRAAAERRAKRGSHEPLADAEPREGITNEESE